MKDASRDITPEDISRLWPVPAPSRLLRTARGTNNHSFIVESGTDDSTYFLKQHKNVLDRERFLFACQLMRGIAAQDPPFAVPETILSRAGETHVVHGGSTFNLSTFIPGTVAAYGDRDDAATCGAALADLHLILSRIDLGSHEAGPPTYGDLGSVHPLVPDPPATIRHVLGQGDLADASIAILPAVQSRWSSVTAGWPLTWIHADFYPSNVLQQAHRVTGIVDFEFSGAGYRAMDFAIGIYAFAFGLPSKNELIDRFGTAYLERMALSEEEIAAISLMILIREATSLVHWIGRGRQGLTDRTGAAERARRLVTLAGVLDRTGADVVTRLQGISARRR